MQIIYVKWHKEEDFLAGATAKVCGQVFLHSLLPIRPHEEEEEESREEE